jgi:O-antigen/teichoic acid export membrane protein
VLEIMTVAWLFNTASGPCGYMLTMSGRPLVQMVNYIFGLAFNVAMNIFLIPRFGITGAAIAWGATIVLLTTVRMAQVWHFMRMLPFNTGFVKGLVAAVISGGFALAIRAVMGGGFASLIVGTAATGVAYLAATILLGIDDDDRVVFEAIRDRFRDRTA